MIRFPMIPLHHEDSLIICEFESFYPATTIAAAAPLVDSTSALVTMWDETLITTARK